MSDRISKHSVTSVTGENPIINVAPTTAQNTAYTAYIDMSGYDTCSLQFEWTAGAAGGTLAAVVYGSIQDDGTEYSSAAYQDITNDVFGVASISGDAIAIDGDNVMGNLKFIKVVATINNKDNATALYVYARKKRN